MSENFLFIDRNVDVSGVYRELQANDELWNMVSNMENVSGDLNPPGFLPLIMGVKEEGKRIKDSEKLFLTPAFSRFPSLFGILEAYGITSLARAAFFKLRPGCSVLSHIDDGTYYHGKDRFHLSIAGEYEYTVNGEMHLITPGTFFWFNNKLLHGAKNVSDVNRLTFVFDIPHADSPIRKAP